MKNKYVSSCEIIYLGYIKFPAKDFSEANRKAGELMDKLQIDRDFPYHIGSDTKIYFGDIRLDNVEYDFGDEYIANINLQYVGDFNVYAEDGAEAWDIAEEMLNQEDIPEEFGIFTLEQKAIYDAAPYEW